VVVRPVLDLQVLKTAIKLGFVKPKTDSITISGVLAVPDGVNVAGNTIVVSIGGIVKTFVLNGKGAAKSGDDSAKLSYKRVSGGGKAKFTIKLGKGDFDSALVALGLVNETVANKVVVLPVEIVFNGTAYQAAPALTYKAKAGKSGSAK
jgi:hypothetical protein